MKSIADYWNEIPKNAVLIIAASAFLLLAWIDFRTGSTVRFSIFYWIPIVGVTWRAGRGWGLAFAFASAAARLWTDLHDLPSANPAVLILLDFLFWCVSFGILCLLIAKLHDLIDTQETMAHTDHTTGMPNARAFAQAIDREISRSRKAGVPFSLAYLDVDDLKEFNDRLGHQAGDQLLRGMATAARSVLRAADVMARVGGDEFALLLPFTGEREARQAMERLMEALVDGVGSGHGTTVSIGLVTVKGGNRTADELLKAADGLMYEAKIAGKNRLIQTALGPID